jgi:hypothetical protein
MTDSGKSIEWVRLPTRPPDISQRRFLAQDGNGKEGEVHARAWLLTAWDMSTLDLRYENIPPGFTLCIQEEDYSHWPPYQNLQAVTTGITRPGPIPENFLDEGVVFKYDDSDLIPYIAVLERLVRERGSNISGGFHFDERGVRWSIQGFTLRGERHKLKDLSPTFHALELIAFIKIPVGGRPENSGTYDEASEPRFFEDIKKAAHAVVQAGDSLSYASLARHGLAGDPRTVKKYLLLFKYDMKKIETEAVRCTRHLDICRFHVRDRAKFKKNKG